MNAGFNKDMVTKDESESDVKHLYSAKTRKRRFSRVNSVDLSFRVEVFRDLVREMVMDIDPEIEIEDSMIKELQLSTEKFIGNILVEAGRIAAVNRRETVEIKDLQEAEMKWKAGLERTPVEDMSTEMEIGD